MIIPIKNKLLNRINCNLNKSNNNKIEKSH